MNLVATRAAAVTSRAKKWPWPGWSPLASTPLCCSSYPVTTLIKALLGSCLLLSCGGKAAPAPQPSPEREVVTETKIEILDKITWAEGATLNESSTPILEAIATTLAGNPDIELLSVEAHAAEQEIAEQRGQAIIDFLLAKEIASERLTNAPKVTEEEKVEFRILRRASDAER